VTELNSQNFTECLHTRFEVHDGTDATMPLELVAVNVQNFSRRVDNFSLVFRGQPSPWLPQCIYRVKHERLGEFNLFLVPIGPDSQGMQYEAVFNRLVDGSR